MPDVFSNLAAQSLSSIVGIQPLISPLFAPAPQLLTDAILSNSNDQPAGAAENAIFANTPSIVADGLIDISEMVQPSKEVITAEKRTVSPDLVPSDVPQNAISTLSVHQLLQPQHLTHDRMEPVSPASPPSSPIETIDEPLSTENTPPVAFPQDDSVGADLSRPSPMVWLLSGAHGTPFNPPAPQPIQSQEATPHNIENTGIPPSSIRHDDQKHTAENSFHAPATNHEPQHTSPKDHPSTPTGDASHFRYLSPSFDKHVAPLPIQPALPVSLPSLQPDVQSEHIVNGDDVLDQESSALVQPQEQSASIPVRKDRCIATPQPCQCKV